MPYEMTGTVKVIMETKTSALAEHRSQRDWLDDSQGMDAYLETMHAFCREMGALSGGAATYAEGWSRHNHLGFHDEGYDPLADLLAPLPVVKKEPSSPPLT